MSMSEEKQNKNSKMQNTSQAGHNFCSASSPPENIDMDH